MKNFSFFILLFSFLFVSCNKSDLALLQENEDATTFTLAIEQEATPAVAKAATRATTTITPARYIMEVWSADGLTAENVFENGTKNQSTITSGGVFTVTLDKTKAYTCLFWADDNAAFNATELKSVALNTGKEATEAYFAKVNVPKGRNLDFAVTLKRAVAKIVLVETELVKTTDNLALSFSNIYPQFNVLNGEASGEAAQWTKTIKPAATTGEIATLYFFAKAEKQLTELAFTYTTEAEQTVSNIPYQQNFATRIKGAYSSFAAFTFTVTADDVWNVPDNDEMFPAKIGFLASEFVCIGEGPYSIPLIGPGFDLNAVVTVKIASSTLGAGECELVNDNLVLPKGQKSGNIQLKVDKTMTTDDRIVLEIEKITFGGIGEDNSKIDSDKKTVACRVPGTE